MLANYKFPKAVKKIEPFSPIVGVLSTCLLVGAAVAECSAPILAAGASLQAACAALHIFGGLASYFGLKRFFDEQTCRTVAIETSMKSSAFGFLLAKLHFSQFLVRVPAAGTIPNTPFLHMWRPHFSHMSEIKFCFLQSRSSGWRSSARASPSSSARGPSSRSRGAGKNEGRQS